MKMYRDLSCACLFVLLSCLLQGCDFGGGGGASPVEAPELPVAKTGATGGTGGKPPSKMGKKATATCSGGKFNCNGAWRQWCSRMKKQCGNKGCTPMCTWTCNSPTCSQHCGPVCNQPVCSTRCKGFNTNSCKMKCGRPSCKVVCPKHFCPQQDCAACKTTCGKPQCKMECGNDHQPCRNVCAQPVCKWECKHPDLCPKPKCAMKCRKAPNCAKNSMHSSVPPLEPGETEIVTVDQGGPSPAPAPALLMQRTAGNMRVNFTSMDKEGNLHDGQVDLAMIQEVAEDSMEESDSWTKMVTEVNGQVTESEASCSSGKFRCHGDATWCAEQQKLGCKEVQTTFLRHQKQTHLQA